MEFSFGLVNRALNSAGFAALRATSGGKNGGNCEAFDLLGCGFGGARSVFRSPAAGQSRWQWAGALRYTMRMSSLLLHDIGLDPAVAKAMQKKARDEGKTPPEYVRSLIERDLLADRSLDEILKTIRDDFRRSGVTEEELDAIVERARGAGHSKRRRTSR